MHYRIAGKADFEECNKLVRDSGEYMSVPFEDLGGVLLIAEDDDGIQGVAWGHRTGKVAYADYLLVASKYQGSGLGARLMLRGMRVMRELGAVEIRTSVDMDNTRMGSIYARIAKCEGPVVKVTLDLREE